MHPYKHVYAKKVYDLTAEICKTTGGGVSDVLNFSDEEIQDLINKVIIALPDSYFYNASSDKLYDLLAFISKNIVFFQVQENLNEKDYAYHLIDFIYTLSLSINSRYYEHGNI